MDRELSEQLADLANQVGYLKLDIQALTERGDHLRDIALRLVDLIVDIPR
jgi:hypothetical protein